jgi:predicted PurR-regulated permease PerM
MQYPLVLGGMAALIYIIPYIGLAVIIVISVLTAYLTTQSVACAAAVLGCCVVFNLFIDYGLAPRVLGKGVGLHPLMVIFAILCGLHLAGPLGTIFAVPVFAALRVIAIYIFPQLAAPLPEESPAATAENQPHSAVSESGKRLAEAESSLG